MAGPRVPAGAGIRGTRGAVGGRARRGGGEEQATPLRDGKVTALMTRDRRNAQETGPLGPVTVLGAHILDVLGRPVEAIPPGQGSARLTKIRATAAGPPAGTAVDLAKVRARVFAIGAIGDDPP